MGCAGSKEEQQQHDPWQLAATGQARHLQRWLELGGNPSALDRQGGRGTLLHAAAGHDQVECVRVLLRAGADANAVTKLRGSPLHAAAAHSGQCVGELLDGGADPLLKNADSKSAIDVATANGNTAAADRMRAAAISQGKLTGLPGGLIPSRPFDTIVPPGQQMNGLVEGVGAMPRMSPQPRVSPLPQAGSHGARTPTRLTAQHAIDGAFGYPKWQAQVDTKQRQEGYQPAVRGLPSETDSVAIMQPLRSGLEPAQPAAAAPAVPTPQPPTPARVSPTPVAPPQQAERERPAYGYGGAASAAAAAASEPTPAPAIQPKNALGTPPWWAPPAGSGQQASPKHSGPCAPSPPSIPEGLPARSAGSGDENGTGSNTSGNSHGSSLLLTDPLLNWINTHIKSQLSLPSQGDGGAAPPTPFDKAASGQSEKMASESQGKLSGRLSSGATLRSFRSSTVDIKPWEIDYEDLQIQRPIGEGSFGKVYLAKWNETLVAVKLLLSLQDIQKEVGPGAALTLSSPVLHNLQKECALMAAMRHPNIVQFMGVSACPPAMITEYCGKGGLVDVLKGAATNPRQASLLTWSRRLSLALDAGKGMLYLHRKGIIHRDLKSPNLLVDSTWRVKIADFNLSKIIDVDGQNAKTGTMAGANPKWLAPEVIAGKPATTAGDVFSFGVVLWELLTWSIPWQKQSPWTVVAQVLGGKRLAFPAADKLPGSPSDNAAFGAANLEGYCALITRCWAQDLQERPQFEDVIRDLRKLAEASVRPSN